MKLNKINVQLKWVALVLVANMESTSIIIPYPQNLQTRSKGREIIDAHKKRV